MDNRVRSLLCAIFSEAGSLAECCPRRRCDAMMGAMRNVIVIVGAGFSGTVLAVKLLKQRYATATDVFLAERAADMGRGIAYAKSRFPFLLNVPAGRLSADGEDPLQFLRFAQAQLPGAGAEDFLPRSLYGD